MAIYTIDEYTKKKKKKTENVFTIDEYAKKKGVKFGTSLNDIAPTVTTTTQKKDEKKWYDGYLKKSDGGVAETVVGSSSDVLKNATESIVGLGEKIADSFAYVAPYTYASTKAQNGGILTKNDYDLMNSAKKDTAKFIEKDLYNEEEVAKKILAGISAGQHISNITQNGGMVTQKDWEEAMLISDNAKKYLDEDMENNSIFDEKADALVQSGAQLLATGGLQSVGVPFWVTTGLTTFGAETENALNQGATYRESGMSGLISAGAEILTEKISGGISFGGKTLDDGLTKLLANNISSRTVRSLAKFGIDAAGEGTEEILSGLMSAIGQKLTYADEKELNELFSTEDAWDSFIGGLILGGGAGGINVIKSAKNGIDYVTGLSKNEEAVVEKEIENRIKESETDEKKLDNKEKRKIREEVMQDLEKGNINLDTIESVLGGQTYESYNSMIERENALKKEIESLQGDARPAMQNRLAEAKKELAELNNNSNRTQMKDQLSLEVQELVKNSKLGESYNERTRRGQAFEADLSQYDTKYHDTIKRAVESGILNNTSKTHDFVDLIAKLSAEKGVSFDFTNNEALKNSDFAIEGKTINGLVQNGNILLNVDSAKALNTVVGHEITHVLEGTELYAELQNVVKEYATTKGEYDTRLKAVQELYKNIKDANIDNELTADLIGDYLFTDSDFINNLSATKPNVFKKIYNEIKHLCKMATAGSKEARQLEKVKRAFEKAYQEGRKLESETQYNISLDAEGKTFVDINEDILDVDSGESVARILQKVLSERFNNLIEANGQKIQVNKTTNDEFRRSNSANALMDNPSQAYNDKLRTIANADEILTTAKNWIGEKIKHTRKDDIVEFARGNVAYRVNGNGYVADVIVATRKNGSAVLYDLVNIYEKNIADDPVTMASNDNSQRRQDMSATEKVTQNSENVKHSLSDRTTPKEYGDFNIYGKDIALESALVPVRENIEENLYLTDEDIPSFLNAGKRANKNRRKAYEEGQQIILKNKDELQSFVKDSIAGIIRGRTVGYGKVGNVLADRIYRASKGEVDVSGFFLELTADDLYHGYWEHETAKKENNLDMTRDELIEALVNINKADVKKIEHHKDNRTDVLLELESQDGNMVLVEVVSLSTGGIKFKTGWKEKRNRLNSAGNNSSNPNSKLGSVRDSSASNNIVPQTSENATRNLSLSDEIAPVREMVQEESENQDVAPTETDKKQRKWVGTSTGSETVDGKVLVEDLDHNLIHYQPISNKTTLGNANAMLGSMGYKDSITYFNGRFASKNVGLDDIALGERLIQEAVKSGDYKTAGELIQNVSILGTELGQKVQALSIIKRLTPEGQLKMLQKTVERGKTKGDKAFEGVEITQEMIDYILSTYGKDGKYNQEELNKAVEDVKQQIANQMKVTGWDKMNAWRYLSMLGNPKTHIRNLVSNVAMRGTLEVKNALARTIETIAPIKNRTKTWIPATDEVKDFAKQTTKEMQDVITGDSKYSTDATIKQKRQIFKNKILNSVYEFNSDMLGREDWWFSKPTFTNALSEYLTANGIKTEQDIANNAELVEKAKNYALEQSQIATFRQYSWLANKINELEHRNKATEVAVGAILPFKKTPINVAKAGLNYSPLGFMKTLTYDISQVKNGKMESSELVDHLSQNVTGSALALVGYMLASSGFLNGAGDDDKEGTYDYQLGKQSYSVNIGGSTYSLSWLSPVAMPLFVGANAYEQLVEGKEWNADVVVETLAQTLDPLSEMSFLSSLDDVLSSYDSGIQKFAGIGEAMAQNYITQFAPTALSQVATVMDDKKRSTKVSKDSGFKFFDETINKLKYKIPFLRETLEPSTDIWGNEIKQTENVAMRAFETFLAPYSKKDSVATEIDAEIKELYAETGDNGILPSIPYNYTNYDGEKYNMSEEEYTAYKKRYGSIANNLLGDLFDNSTYRNASSEEQAEMIGKVYDYAREEAKKELLSKRGVKYTNATKDKVEYYREAPIKGAIEEDLTVDEYTFSIDYPEKYKFFNDNGINYDDYKNGTKEEKEVYNWAYENPKKYSVSKAVSSDLVWYRETAKEIGDIRADKDSSGKSISGSAKAKKLDYINNLDLEYGQRVILYRSLFSSEKDKDTYNPQVIDYLNNRDDISREEMINILEELDMKVDSNGNVTW